MFGWKRPACDAESLAKVLRPCILQLLGLILVSMSMHALFVWYMYIQICVLCGGHRFPQVLLLKTLGF